MTGRQPASVWVGPTRVDDRIDTRPYKPWVLAHLDRCTAFPGGTIRLGAPGVCSQLSRGVGGGKPSRQAVAVYKAKEVTGYGFSAPELFLAECAPEKVLRDGDVALTSSGIGTIGRADLFDARSFPNGARCTVDNHVTIIRTASSSLLPEFLVAFLNSSYGKAWSEWGTTGSTRLLELSPSKVRRFEVPKADIQVQKHVAARVRLADHCRAAAAELLREAQSRFNDLLGVSRFTPSLALSNVVQPSSVSNRLDGGFYLRQYFDLEAHLRSLAYTTREIGTMLRGKVVRTTTPERAATGEVPCILTSDIDPQEIRWRAPSLRVTPGVHHAHPGRLEAMDVVYTSVGPPVGEAAVVLPRFLPMAVGGDVSILRPGEELHPGYLSLYLNSVFGQMQNDRYSRGIRQRRVYPEDVGSFLIPAIPAEQQAFIGKRVVRYESLEERAVDLVNEARENVEALIEGQLDVRAITAGRLKALSPRDIPELTEEGA